MNHCDGKKIINFGDVLYSSGDPVGVLLS